MIDVTREPRLDPAVGETTVVPTSESEVKSARACGEGTNERVWVRRVKWKGFVFAETVLTGDRRGNADSQDDTPVADTDG
jgi:hypothetical protein